jgi:predicted flap endonuclease-1-like 5' DNA nuclease
MTIILGLALMALGLVIGFIVSWAFRVGATTGLFVGVLLVVAGAIIGFVVEWLIDEAYRRNRELRRQLTGQTDVTLALGATGIKQGGDVAASQTLADFLRLRDEELRELREQLSVADARVGTLEDEFVAYQSTHPDDLTVIKGIGSVYQWKLRDAGFNTYRQLATANPDQLRRMLDIKNWQRVNIESWIEQARDWAQREQ